MPTIEIAYDYTEEHSEECASNGNGYVDDDGRYVRSINLDVLQYQTMRNLAEKDEDATITQVNL